MEKSNTPIAVQLTGKRNKSRALDYYPTPPLVTHALMRFLDLPKHYRVWEPACGTHMMSDVIASYVDNVIATDIINGYDFLSSPTVPLVDAVITNPPFYLSEKFIIRALEVSPIVCMLLKSQYWHAAKRLPLFERFPPAWILPIHMEGGFLSWREGWSSYNGGTVGGMDGWNGNDTIPPTLKTKINIGLTPQIF